MQKDVLLKKMEITSQMFNNSAKISSMSNTFPYAFIRGEITPIEKALIPIQAKVVQYGLGCYTGLRAHWDGENLYLFRLEEHFERLKNAAKILGMHFPYDYEKFKETLITLIKKNGAKEDIYLRITLYCASTKLTPRLNNPDDDLAIYLISLKDYFDSNKALNIGITKYARIDNDMIPIEAKSTGSYINSALAKSDALSQGYDECLFLNRQGHVCEASGANIFAIHNNTAITPPLTDNILNGITRKTLIQLLKDELNIPTQERSLLPEELTKFEELFFCGTAAKITAIATINKQPIAGTPPYPTIKRLQSLLDDIFRNKLKKYSHWLTKVY